MEKDSVVERRMRYIERQKKLGHGVNVRFEGLKPRGSGPLNRHGMPQIPIDQHLVRTGPFSTSAIRLWFRSRIGDWRSRAS